jgi:hypothetical protein
MPLPLLPLLNPFGARVPHSLYSLSLSFPPDFFAVSSSNPFQSHPPRASQNSFSTAHAVSASPLHALGPTLLATPQTDRCRHRHRTPSVDTVIPLAQNGKEFVLRSLDAVHRTGNEPRSPLGQSGAPATETLLSGSDEDFVTRTTTHALFGAASSALTRHEQTVHSSRNGSPPHHNPGIIDSHLSL